jgi:UDP-N-acetylmuramoyl-L-alanyl-D-glutamate--2,6-diaminopimelate ligase
VSATPATSIAAPTVSTAALAPRPVGHAPVEITELAALVGARLLQQIPGETRVTGATLRSVDVRPGDLFAALPGARAHGADHVAAALAAGATALLTDSAGAHRPQVADSGVPVLVHDDPRAVLGAMAARVYGDPTARLGVIGVTGTSGKTTVSYLIEAGLKAAGRRTGLIGTVRTTIADEVWSSALTTPEAPELQALFAIMLERGVTDAVMEVSSHSLALHRVAGTRFAVGAFTNLSQDHLDFHRDMDDYFAAKSLLFDGRATAEVVNVDDDWGARLIKNGTVTVSADGRVEADWRAVGVRGSADGGQRFTAVDPSGEGVEVTLPLPGAFMVANALLALACLDAAGVPARVAAAGMSSISVPGRLQRVDAGQPYLALVDYAHKPGAVAALLDTLRAQLKPAGRLLVVLGCGGDRDAAKRPLMGAAAAKRAELLVITDDNPRTETPAAIRAAMRAGAVDAPPLGEVLEIGDRREAIAAAVRRACPEDIVVVAGKGHETGQRIGDTTRPFDDVAELAAAIRDQAGSR